MTTFATFFDWLGKVEDVILLTAQGQFAFECLCTLCDNLRGTRQRLIVPEDPGANLPIPEG